jgi:ubiquinone/menaquinone biosynthesis C-methylase UbiE
MKYQQQWPRTDYEDMAGVYDSGRALSPDDISAWRAALAPYFGDRRGQLLDLGAGTGFFGRVLMEWFGLMVVAVEPSEAMLAQAVSRRLEGVRGRAEALPLKSGSCTGAWLSKVFHHFEDVDASGRELHRVLQPGAYAVVRNSFADRLDHVVWLRYFPEARAVAASRWPRVEHVTHAFSAAGLKLIHIEDIPEVAAPDLPSYCKRVAKRANSTLTLIDDAAFAAGLERIKAEAAGGHSGPVIERQDMVVFKRKE